MDVVRLIEQARRPERTVAVCLRADLVAEHEELEHQLAAAQSRTVDSLAGNGSTKIAEKIGRLERRMAEATVTLRMRALSRVQYRELLEAHPPRRGEDGDPIPADADGYNTSTFFDALTGACLVSPELDEQHLAALLDALSPKQYDQVAGAALAVCVGEVDIPFSRAASRLTGSCGPA